MHEVKTSRNSYQIECTLLTLKQSLVSFQRIH